MHPPQAQRVSRALKVSMEIQQDEARPRVMVHALLATGSCAHGSPCVRARASVAWSLFFRLSSSDVLSNL
jgi:hypothetical protein